MEVSFKSLGSDFNSASESQHGVFGKHSLVATMGNGLWHTKAISVDYGIGKDGFECQRIYHKFSALEPTVWKFIGAHGVSVESGFDSVAQ